MKDTVALITGGAGHIGRETCHKLASDGCHLAILDKNETAAHKLAAELNQLAGCEASVIVADIMEPSAFKSVYEQVNEKFARLDYLINCAAFYDDTPGWGVPLEEESYEAWVNVLRVNMLAPFFIAQTLYP